MFLGLNMSQTKTTKHFSNTVKYVIISINLLNPCVLEQDIKQESYIHIQKRTFALREERKRKGVVSKS